MRFQRNLRYAISWTWIPLLLLGCDAPAVTPLPPTPALEPAHTFVSGVAEIPEGQYLFVEWWADSHAESWLFRGCNLYYDGPGYQGGSWGLRGGIPADRPAPGPAVGFFGTGNSSSGDGECGAFSQLLVITSFPYVAPQDGIVIHSVDAGGTIVAEVEGGTFRIEPSQSWTHTAVEKKFLTTSTTTYRLTNHGLLNASQIDVRGFRPGAVVPTVTPITCTHHQPPKTEGGIWDLEVAPDGNIWVATARGVARFDPVTESWTSYASEDGLAGDKVNSITIEPNGSVWFTIRDEGGVSHLDGVSWMHFTTDDGLISNDVRNVSIAPDGSVWFATFEGASHWNRETDTWTHYTKADGLYRDWVWNILFTPDGKIWFAHVEAATYLTPASSPDEENAWQIYGQSQVLGTQHAITSADGKLWLGQVFFDPASQQWVETVYQDIYVAGLAVDGGGGLWVATGRTEAVYIPDPLSTPRLTWLHYDSSEGIVGDRVEAVALEADNIVWFGTEVGVSRCIIEAGSE